MRMRSILGIVGSIALLSRCVPSTSTSTPTAAPVETTRAEAVAAFAVVERVFQHPRCRNCHIPGDAPLQFDAGLPHQMLVVRGLDGKGAPGLACASCHNTANAPASYGPNAPPGAPNWHLPPPEHKMAWIDLPASQLCTMIKDKNENGGKDMDALIDHIAEDKLVLWGWDPGGTRAPVSVPHAEFVAAFQQWAAAGGPCP